MQPANIASLPGSMACPPGATRSVPGRVLEGACATHRSPDVDGLSRGPRRRLRAALLKADGSGGVCISTWLVGNSTEDSRHPEGRQ